jgi:hypothetical protein
MAISGYSKTIATAPLLHTCPSRKVITAINGFDQPQFPAMDHQFDCPANGMAWNSDANPDLTLSTTSFMDPSALHGVHTLIFLTVVLELGRIVALHYRSSTSYQIH